MKFSIIVDVYNCENYIKKSIDSVLNQSINFEENVQLIIIDKDSSDKTLDILYEYQNSYPNNILIFTKEFFKESYNLSQVYDYITGEYVTFLSNKDHFTKNTLKDISMFLKNNPSENVVSIPINNPSNKNDMELNNKFNNITDSGDSIEITEKFDFIQNFLISSFIKFDTLKRFDFDLNNNFNTIEGTFLINKILAEENKIGLIKTSKYFKIDSQSYIYTTPKDFEKEFFISNLNFYYSNIINYFKNQYGHVPHFIQNMIAYNLSKVVQHNYNFLNKKEEEKLFTYLYNILLNIDSKIIIQNDFIQRHIKSFLTYIKNNQQSFINIENNQLDFKSKNFLIDRLSYHPIYLTYKKIEDNTFTLRGMYNSHFNSDYLTFEAIIENENGDTEVVESLNLDFDQKEKKISYNLNKPWEYANYFEFNIKFKDDNNKKIYFRTKYNDLKNNYEYLPKIEYAYKSGITEENNIIYSETNKISFEKEFIGIEKSYLFSIIMAIYNTGNYLDESILSVINQSLNFEKYTQLILVNDGSTDNSLEICKEYQAQYPDNIILINQQNAGQSTARNNGLKYVKGRYVNFLDSDDCFEENTLEEVYEFFTKNDQEIDVVSIPIKFFGRKENYHMLNNKFKNTRVVNLEKEPNNPQLSGPSSFFKSQLFHEYQFPCDVFTAEDSILLNKILFRKKKIGLLNTTHYNYRKRMDHSSTIDSTSEYNKDFFITQLKNYFLYLINYSIEKEEKVIPYIQYVLAYDLQWILKNEDLPPFNDKELSEFKELLNEVVKHIDEKCIRENVYVTNYIFISYFMYIKNKDFHKEIGENDVKIKTNNYYIDNLKKHNIWLDIVEIKDDTLIISGFLNSNFNKNSISIYATKENEEGVKEYKAKEVKYTSRQNIRYLSENWQYKYSFDIKIPIATNEVSKIKIKTNYHIDEDINNLNEDNLISMFLNIKLTKYAKISDISNYIVKDNYLLHFEKNTFTIEKYSYNKLKVYESIVQNNIINKKTHNYIQALELRRKIIDNFPLIRFYKKIFKIYLFVDRHESADDNSEHLFRYATKKMDRVKKYFVVSKESKDFERLSKYGKVLDYKSKEHKFMYLLADKVISTHPYESGTNPFFSYEKKLDERDNYAGLITSQNYFLQHGVTKDNISDWMSKFDKNLSLLSTVSDKERESFYVEGYGYDKNIIQTLGFPRYDNLKNDDNKQILIIPTWRKYLRGNKKLFMNSGYYKKIESLLNNPKFIKYTKENGYSIIFKAHPELEKNINDTDERYIDLFNIPDEVRLSTEESYQELFNKSSLLITDYSSVFFDFAYMKKPIIYYHPNDDYHYEQGYFDYETMGFGEIIKDENDLVNLMIEYMNNDCNMKKKYIGRVENFFKYNDKNNCKRVYNWIKKN